jgi:hypothetical protein
VLFLPQLSYNRLQLLSSTALGFVSLPYCRLGPVPLICQSVWCLFGVGTVVFLLCVCVQRGLTGCCQCCLPGLLLLSQQQLYYSMWRRAVQCTLPLQRATSARVCHTVCSTQCFTASCAGSCSTASNQYPAC